MIELIGISLAISGTVISIIGVWQNNIHHRHVSAMHWWMWSNLLLLAWSIGNTLGYWNGGLSGAALVLMYAVFTITNMYGIRKKP